MAKTTSAPPSVPRVKRSRDPERGDLDQMVLEARLLAEKKKLILVQEVGQALSANMKLKDLLMLIMEHLTILMEADRSTLYLLSDDATELWSQVAQGDDKVEISLKVGEGIAGWVASTGNAVNIADAYNDKRFQRAVDKKTGYRTKTILCVPMQDHDGNIIGVVQVLNKKEGPFDEEDEALLHALASQAAIAIVNTKLYQSVREKSIELERKNLERTVLYEIEREMNIADDLDELLDRILEKTISLMGATAGSIALISKNLGDLRFHTTIGEHSDQMLKRRLPLGKGIIGWSAEKGMPAIVNNPSNDNRFAQNFAAEIGHVPQNVLCAPLFMGDEILGAIEVIDKISVSESGRTAFDEEDLQLLQLIAGQTSRAVQLAQSKMEKDNENRLATIGQMLAGVMHDLKTPMTTISWYADLMVDLDDRGQRKEFTELIKSQFKLMNGMTREVLAFARGETHLFIMKVHLNNFLSQVVEHLQHAFKDRNISLELDLHYKRVAYFDPLKMQRVVHNLARNAVQAMPEGGTFTITSHKKGDELVFTFHDNGPGIPADMQDKLFDPFTTSGKKQGTGLGLAIVKKIIDEHRGTISCVSNQNEGTRFIVTLPLEVPESATLS